MLNVLIRKLKRPLPEGTPKCRKHILEEKWVEAARCPY